MRILAVSDVVVDQIYTPNVAEYVRPIDLVLGCGDLPYEYLEFLNTVLKVPLLYVPGNHDPEYSERNPGSRAEGCEYLDRSFLSVKGLNIAGIGGSIRYKPGHPNQFTQSQMYLRLARFYPRLRSALFRHGGALDILIAHSPPFGIHDDDDPAHIGFTSLLDFIRIFKPRYFLHGHTLNFKSNLEPEASQLGTTTILNVNPYLIFELEPNVR